MGRINANGNPFLIERAEGGFTYFRNIPPALRAAAAGEVARRAIAVTMGCRCDASMPAPIAPVSAIDGRIFY